MIGLKMSLKGHLRISMHFVSAPSHPLCPFLSSGSQTSAVAESPRGLFKPTDFWTPEFLIQ